MIGNNIIEFVATIKETVSGGMNKIAATAANAGLAVSEAAAKAGKNIGLIDRNAAGLSATMSKSTAKMTQSIRGVDSNVSGLNSRLDNLRKAREISLNAKQVKEVNKEIDQTARKLENLSKPISGASGGGLSFGGMFGANFLADAAYNAVSSGLSMGVHSVFGLLKDTLDYGMQTQRQIVGLGTFVGDKQANSIYNRLFDKAAYTPYTTSQLLPIESGLIAAGKSVERSERDMMALVNAVAATGGDNWALERMGVLHLPQVAARGHMDAMMAREFTIARIPIQKILADYLHKPISRIADFIKNGKISYDVLTNALYKASQAGGVFANALYRLSQTVSGKWSTIMDYWRKAQWTIFNSASPGITRIEDKIISLVKSLPERVDAYAPQISNLFDRFIAWLPNLKGIASNLLSIAKKSWDFITSQEAADLATGIVQLTTTITSSLIPLLKDIAEFTRGVWQGLMFLVPHPAEGSAERIRGEIHDMVARQKDPLYDYKKYYASVYMPIMGANALHNSGVNTTLLAKYGIKNQNDTAAIGKGNGTDTPPPPDTGAFNTGENITGGGRRVINININKSFVENFTINAKEIKEGYDNLKTRVEEIFLEILNSANAVN